MPQLSRLTDLKIAFVGARLLDTLNRIVNERFPSCEPTDAEFEACLAEALKRVSEERHRLANENWDRVWSDRPQRTVVFNEPFVTEADLDEVDRRTHAGEGTRTLPWKAVPLVD